MPLAILVIGFLGKAPKGVYCGNDGAKALVEANKAVASGEFSEVRLLKGTDLGSRIVPAPKPHAPIKPSRPVPPAPPSKAPAPTAPTPSESTTGETSTQNESEQS